MLVETASEQVSNGKGRVHRIRNWTRYRAADLWHLWRQQFDSDDDAIATAVWMANRMVKDKARSTRKTFYSIKDEFIRRYAVVGRRAREEKKICFACGGSGEDPWCNGVPCERCNGTGIYASRWLYLHEFDVAGTPYRFHSYVEPKLLLDGQDAFEIASAEVAQYDGRFTDEELQALALPMTGLLRMLCYVAASKWGLRIYDGQYR